MQRANHVAMLGAESEMMTRTSIWALLPFVFVPEVNTLQISVENVIG
jgi:hypothetical protein